MLFSLLLGNMAPSSAIGLVAERGTGVVPEPRVGGGSCLNGAGD